MAKGKGSAMIDAAKLEEIGVLLDDAATKPVPPKASYNKAEAVNALKEKIGKLLRHGYTVDQVRDLLRSKGMDVGRSLVFKHVAVKKDATSGRAKEAPVDGGDRGLVVENAKQESTTQLGAVSRGMEALQAADAQPLPNAAAPGRLRIRPDRAVL